MNLDERTIQDAAPDTLPSILGELARLTALATLRLTTPTVAPVAAEPEPDRLLSAEEAASRLGLTPAQLLRKRDFPARRKIGKLIRFSSRAIERYLRTRAA